MSKINMDTSKKAIMEHYAKLSPKELQLQLKTSKILNFILNVAGVLSIFFILLWPGILAFITCGTVVYFACKMSIVNKIVTEVLLTMVHSNKDNYK